MPSIRKGAAAIEEAAQRKGGGSGDFKPFAPTVRWKNNGEEKYVLILTPIEETPVLDVHEFVQIGIRENGKPQFGFYASRKDPAIGEDYDQLEDDFGMTPSERTIGVAVELEPEYESSSGRSSRRPRVKKFKIATDTYDKKDEDGNTDEVTFPLIGIVSQASKNFYNHIRSHDADYGPIYELPLKVKRIGTSTDTQYSFTPFMDQEIDFSDLIEYIENVSYVDEEVRDKAKNLDPAEAAQLIAQNILDKRIEELTDKDEYDEAVTPLTSIKGYKEVFHRGGSNEDVDEPEVKPEPEPEVEEESQDEDKERDEAWERIKQRAAKKNQK